MKLEWWWMWDPPHQIIINSFKPFAPSARQTSPPSLAPNFCFLFVSVCLSWLNDGHVMFQWSVSRSIFKRRTLTYNGNWWLQCGSSPHSPLEGGIRFIGSLLAFPLFIRPPIWSENIDDGSYQIWWQVRGWSGSFLSLQSEGFRLSLRIRIKTRPRWVIMWHMNGGGEREASSCMQMFAPSTTNHRRNEWMMSFSTLANTYPSPSSTSYPTPYSNVCVFSRVKWDVERLERLG